ncbi:MAG: hypothetical protein ACRC0K_00005 [Fusobacteriaceae bacterium]
MKGQEQLRDEIEEFKREKEQIKQMVGEIGGTESHQNKLVNILLLVIIVMVLIAGLALKKIDIIVTLEVAILLGIFKIIWILYENKRVDHFQFWILNSLEFRINEIHKKVKNIEKELSNK